MKFDYLVIGCGIVGLTVALEIKRKLGGSVCILEKESSVGAHASSRNSGVLHAGIYYKPGTLKGKLSVEGNRTMQEYCNEKGLTQVKGKVIVTKSQSEIETLKELEQRATSNGANVRIISADELKEIEPYAVTTEVALYSPNTVTVDPKAVLEKLLEDAKFLGITVYFDTSFLGLKGKDEAITSGGTISFGFLINAAGAYADKISHMYGLGLNYVMLPYKGIYYRLKDEFAHMVRSNIYPVPDIRFPFLGVHFTKTPNGVVKIGPTAIPALSKENYQMLDHIKGDEFLDVIMYNSRKLVTDFNYALMGVKEVSNYIPYIFYSEARRLLPALKFKHIVRYPKSGIRAQLYDKTKHDLESDFIVLRSKDSLHILNAVSPAFTSSLTFAKYVIEQLN